MCETARNGTKAESGSGGTEKVKCMKSVEGFALFADSAVFAYRRISNLRRINGDLEFKSTPRNQIYLIFQ